MVIRNVLARWAAFMASKFNNIMDMLQFVFGFLRDHELTAHHQAQLYSRKSKRTKARTR